jgi:hemolysin III
MPLDPIHSYLFRDPVSAGTHLLFCAWALCATVLLRRIWAGNHLRRRCITFFGLSIVLLYGASGLYHAIPASHPRLIALFLRLDLAAIHVLIAGTCTPIFALLLCDPWRRALLALVWLLAAMGAASKLFLDLPPFRLTLALYIATGAVGCLPIVEIARAVGPRGLAWLIGGALVYAAGGTCEALRLPVVLPGFVGHHEILHICDMIGTSCHLVFVVRFVLPCPRRC